VKVSVNFGPGSGFWAAHLLDSFVAPEMSKVSVCAAPDIPEPPDYFGSYFLTNVLIAPIPKDVRPLVIVFLRRWTFAVREYRAGRDHLSTFAFDLSKTNNQIALFVTALGHFEHCIIHTYLALMAVRALIQVRKGPDPDVYKKGDGSAVRPVFLNFRAERFPWDRGVAHCKLQRQGLRERGRGRRRWGSGTSGSAKPVAEPAPRKDMPSVRRAIALSFIVQRRTSLRQCNVSVSGQRELKDGAAERIGARP
jgi:hypothetical protein